MPIDCTRLVDDALASMRLEFDCAPYGAGVSVVTPYLRSDSGLIEVFVAERDGCVRVSDEGETFRSLKLRGADPLASTRGRFIAERTAARLHVDLQQARIEKVTDAVGAASAILDVAAAAHALDGLIYTSRAVEPANFSQEVRSFLDESEREYDAGAPIEGLSGKTYRVGFRLLGAGGREAALLQPLSPARASGITPLVNRTVRMWVDLENAGRKVSLLNDVDYEWRPEDSALLKRLSIVALWSKKEQLLNVA